MTTPSATGDDGNWGTPNRSGNNTLRIAQMNVSLRPLEDRDLDAIYQQMRDPRIHVITLIVLDLLRAPRACPQR